MLTRREFSKSILATGATLLASSKAAFPAQTAGAPQRLDYLIKGGTVVDPSQQLHALMDVGLRNGKVVEIARDIPESRASLAFSAKDKIVTPGLIDIHVHCYDGFADCVNADYYCLAKGVTTVVDGGSVGYPAMANFHRYVINTAATRIKALVNISPLGAIGPGGSIDALKYVDSDLTARAAEDNKPAVVGIKVRLGEEVQGANDVEYLKRGLRAAEAAGLPLMAHIDGPHSPLEDLLPLLRKGDVYTHFLHSHQHGSLDANGKLLPVVLEARQRGVWFDVAQGRTHLGFDVVERCLQQGFLPDTLSTDLTRTNSAGAVHDLPTILSKFMALGLSLDNVIEMVTSNAARVFDFGAAIGTLKPGSEADIGIFELREGNFEFEDSDGKKRPGRQKLMNTAVFRRGQLTLTGG